MSFSVTNMPKTNVTLIKLKNLDDTMKKGIAAGFEEIGSNMMRTAENQALESKHGKKYKIRNSRGVKKNHRASAPGESPALLSGNYFSNFKYIRTGHISLEFGNDSEYADFLEFGTKRSKTGRGRWRMRPRPGVMNAVKSSIRNARVIMETNIGKHSKL